MFWLIKISYGYVVDLNVYKRESPITVISLIIVLTIKEIEIYDL